MIAGFGLGFALWPRALPRVHPAADSARIGLAARVPVAIAPQPLATNEWTADRLMTLEAVEEAILVALGEPYEPARRVALRRVAEAADMALFPALLPRLDLHFHSLVRQEMPRYVLRRWARNDGSAALAYAQKLPVSTRRQNALEAVVAEWAKQDDAAAFAWVAGQPPSLRNQQLVRSMLLGLAERNPAKAFTLAQSVKSHQRELRNAVLQTWSETDPAAAAAALTLLAEKDSGTLAQVAGNWALRDPEAALAWVKSLPGANPLDYHLDRFVEVLARAHSDLAMDFANAFPDGTTRATVIRRIAGCRAAIDLESARAWVEQLPEGYAKKQASEELWQAKVEADPRAAIEEISRNANVAARDELISLAARDWSFADPSAACAWAATVPYDQGWHALVGSFGGWVQESPDTARAFTANLPAGKARDYCVGEVLRKVAADDPQAAFDWANQQVTGQALDTSLGTIAAVWAQTDPVATGLWVDSLPAGETRDRVVCDYAKALSFIYDAGTAMSWAQSIANENRRVEATAEAAGAWIAEEGETNGEAIREWIEHAQLSPEAKGEILKAIPEAEP